MSCAITTTRRDVIKKTQSALLGASPQEQLATMTLDRFDALVDLEEAIFPG
jgi:hypothetical protein